MSTYTIEVSYYDGSKRIVYTGDNWGQAYDTWSLYVPHHHPSISVVTWFDNGKVSSTFSEVPIPKRGEPTVGRTANEPHRPLVCYVCAKDFPITFNFCHEHKEEYERLKKENKEEFTRGWNAALQTYPPKETNENPKHDTLHDLMHFLCTGEATPQIQELFSPLVSNKTVPVPTERSHRSARLGTHTGL